MTSSVCLVTSGNISSNPRVVKEARALTAAGYTVRIVAADIIPFLSPYDEELIASLNCKVARVIWHRPRLVRILRSTKRLAARLVARAFRANIPLAISVRAYHALTPALAKKASRYCADLYIAHNLAALPAAAAAADRNRSKFGFDAEDYHSGELPDNKENRLELRIRRSIEAALLNKCAHLTSASPGISEAYAQQYHVRMLPVLNVFPKSDAPLHPVESSSERRDLPSLYWFSQTVGPNRGLEEIIAIIALLNVRVRLVLRGHPSSGYPNRLHALAYEVGGEELAKRVDFLPVEAPTEMARLAAGHDLGLAIEPGRSRNNEIALSNKAFTYLLAGLPVLLSNTPAQRALGEQLVGAAFVINLEDPPGAAHLIDTYLSNVALQRSARAKAWCLGQRRFNWDLEQGIFLASVRAATG